MAKRMRDPVEGTFRVVTAVLTSSDEGRADFWVAGVVFGDGVPPTAVDLTAHGPWRGEWRPRPGDQIPAMIDREQPSRCEIQWPPRLDLFGEMTRGRAYAARVAAAMRLGLDPAGVPEEEPPAARLRSTDAARAMVAERRGGGPLPDGRPPVGGAEAERLIAHGEAAAAVVTAIDFLPVPAADLPVEGASIANVTLAVTRADGTAYTAVARFGFRTPARRAQIGFAGASVPVRLDPADPSRLALDRNALPPLPG